MKPRGPTPDQVAKETGVPVQHINEIVQCKRAITLEIALRLERYFGSSAQEWRDNLQTLNLFGMARGGPQNDLGGPEKCPQATQVVPHFG